jgi:hypothetical protein
MPDGWNYVGTVDFASGTYLGNGWVITAAHVGSISMGTNFTLDGYGTYACNGNVVRLTDPNTSLDVDLQMFQISGTPSLPLPNLQPLNIAGTTPAAGTPLYMVGYGHSTRAVSPTYYDVSPDPLNPGHYIWTPVVTPDPDSYGGFTYDPTIQTKRWGTTLTTTDPNPSDPSYGQTTESNDIGEGATTTLVASFYNSLTDYQNGGQTPEEGMVTAGDSGGGEFDSDNTLVALNAYYNPYPDQPADTVIFGDGMDPIDLAAYQSEILTVVPEPTGTLMAAAMIFPLLAWRRRGPARKSIVSLVES